jgi:beta-xylosidase
MKFKSFQMLNFVFISLISGIIMLVDLSCKEKENILKEIDNNDSTLYYNLNINDIVLRDPFIFPDTLSKSYYMHVGNRPNIRLYKSKDLLKWKDEGFSFSPSPEFWGKNDFWAPDMYLYNNNYYMLVTFSSTTHKRGVSILVSDNPAGTFEPLENEPITPSGWGCLDGTLYLDEDNQPWIVYCREWLEVIDGEIYAQQVTMDLKDTIGVPELLFRASEAPWTGAISSGVINGYVTDAPFLYKTESGVLIMLWSSFTKNGEYAIGIARSSTGNILGPWEQSQSPINNDGGGHAMLFKDFDGRLMISYHAPNTYPTKAVIKEVYEDGGTIIIPTY